MTATTEANAAESMRRQGRLARSADRARCGACGSILADDGTCGGCGSTLHATRPSLPPARCPKCKGRLNSYSNKCARCDTRPALPSAPDAPPPANPNQCPRRCGKAVHKGRCGGLRSAARAEASEAKPVRVERVPAPPIPAPAEPRPVAECKAATPEPAAVDHWRPERATYRFHQQADDMSLEPNDGNALVVEVIVGGAGPYLVLKTRRWAVSRDEIDRLAATLRRCLEQWDGEG